MCVGGKSVGIRFDFGYDMPLRLKCGFRGFGMGLHDAFKIVAPRSHMQTVFFSSKPV